MNRATTFAWVLLSVLAPSIGSSADVPVSPYLKRVYQYADAMLAEGRDTFGPHPSGLFLSALGRTTMKPPNVRPAPPGVGQHFGDMRFLPIGLRAANFL